MDVQLVREHVLEELVLVGQEPRHDHVRLLLSQALVHVDPLHLPLLLVRFVLHLVGFPFRVRLEEVVLGPRAQDPPEEHRDRAREHRREPREANQRVARDRAAEAGEERKVGHEAVGQAQSGGRDQTSSCDVRVPLHVRVVHGRLRRTSFKGLSGGLDRRAGVALFFHPENTSASPRDLIGVY